VPISLIFAAGFAENGPAVFAPCNQYMWIPKLLSRRRGEHSSRRT